MKKISLDTIRTRIVDGQEHLEFLLSIETLLKNKGLDVGDVAFYKTDKNVMEPCIIAKILVPTFQMFKAGRHEVLASIRTAQSEEFKVKYKDLFKYDTATEILYK